MLRRSLLCLLFLLAASMPFAHSAPVLAVDANCTRAVASGNVGYHPFIPVGGWGLTAWRVIPNAEVFDRCDHGAAGINVSLRDDNVVAKGGSLRITAVVYKVSNRDEWVTMTLRSGINTSFLYTGGLHVDLAREVRITHIRVFVAVYSQQDAAPTAIPIARSVTTCNLQNGSCS